MMWQRWIDELEGIYFGEFWSCANDIVLSRKNRGLAMVTLAKDRVALEKAWLDTAQRGQELQRKFDMITACLDGFKAGVKAVGK